jgi:hypothetical protein
MCGFGLAIGGASADENSQTASEEIKGDALGFAAQTGQAITSDLSIVQQKDIQVVAAQNADATQTATNTANVSQTTVAASGDATASGGGTASTGNAVASSLSVVHQMNIQVVAGNGTCTVTQVASNTAKVSQTAVAASGDATSSGAGSATSGDAEAKNRSIIKQKNVQIYVCKIDGGSGAQTASSNAGVLQDTIAVSGDATSSGAGSATSGVANASSDSTTSQKNKQRTVN